MLSKISREPRELPWQPNLGKNEPKLNKTSTSAARLAITQCTVCAKSSRCKTPSLIYSPAHGAVTTSLQCCVNFIGRRSRDEWSILEFKDCVSRTPIARFNGANVPVCRHSTHLRARSSSSALIFSQNTGCSTDAHRHRGQKFRCYGTEPVEHFAVYFTTDHQLRTV